MMFQVNAWMEEVTIPTYPIGKPEKNPMFLEKRVYQGSSGVVYPHPVIEKIYDEKINKTYNAAFLENEYIKMMVLPELGGRIQMAYDKVKQRHFIYYNQVIKPALVGLTGPWISGGIEFNWPQHHRPSTFEPVDFTIEENKDGSKTIWINEVERMFQTKGMAGFTLYPGKAYIEVSGKLYNRTPFPQTFLWWANPAVKVNEHYQSIFPPDVYAVFDHGKRDVSSFPIAKGTYYKIDYSPGTDISRYKNIPVPTSYMAITSKYNFIGGYEHDTNGGLLHVANHHISPGKKQWTWGHCDFGQAWDKNLTDEDGPYIELMTGVFTDNQPDFSWLQPFEEKAFVQYFMPYRDIGEVKNASKEAVVGIQINKNEVNIKVYLTATYRMIKIKLQQDNKELYSEVLNDISPETPYIKTIVLPANVSNTSVLLTVTNLESNKVIIAYQEEKILKQEIPSPAQEAINPGLLENNEQLYLTGLHLEQYRHATFAATDYYEEALRRDDKDVRNNNALGLWYLRRGKFTIAEPYFRQAIDTLTQRNPNPYESEPYYNLGLALKMQDRIDESYNAFYKSVWSDAWQHAGYLNLARIAVLKQDFEDALELIDKSLIKNYHSHTARHLKVAILRKLDKTEEAFSFASESLINDPFNFGCLFEQYLLLKIENKNTDAFSVLRRLITLSRNWVHNFIEYAFDYAHAGLYAEGITLLLEHTKHTEAKYPMVYYYLGWMSEQMGLREKALDYFAIATSISPDYCFPNRIEDVPVLKKAIELNKQDAKAYYYLGNYWYDKRQYKDAIECWALSAEIDNTFPTVLRNLSLACYNKLHNSEKAKLYLEKAFSLDTSDARVLMELDQLYKKFNVKHEQRLLLLEQYLLLTMSRDDLYLERVTLYNQLQDYTKVKELLTTYKFHPWEGGEGKVVRQYLIAYIELAKNSFEKEDYESALQLLGAAENYPDNLGEGKLFGVQENDIHYLKGCILEKMGRHQIAERFYKMATEGNSEPVQAIFYNDAQPDKIFYQGLAWLKLDDPEKAHIIFNKLISFGQQHLNDDISIDYFAVSLPDLLVFDADLNLNNKIHCLYLQGLGYMGLGKTNTASALFNEVLQSDVNHQGASIHKQMMQLKLFNTIIFNK